MIKKVNPDHVPGIRELAEKVNELIDQVYAMASGRFPDSTVSGKPAVDMQALEATIKASKKPSARGSGKSSTPTPAAANERADKNTL